MDLKERGCEVMWWLHLAQDRAGSVSLPRK